MAISLEMGLGLRRTVRAAASAVDVETGLVLTSSVAVGGTPSISDRASSVVFAMDFTGFDGSAGGIIADFGGNGVGAYMGFDASGNFTARCGDGASRWQTGTAYFIKNSASVISGAGTLVVALQEISENFWTVRVFWNGSELAASQSADNTSASTQWAGTDASSYLIAGGASTVPTDEYKATIPTYSSASPLRIYEAQEIAA